MTAPESTKKRRYAQHGHYALSKALKTIGNQDGWIESLGEIGEALKAWKWCPRPGSNRYTLGRIRDFKSRASANSATRARADFSPCCLLPQQRCLQGMSESLSSMAVRKVRGMNVEASRIRGNDKEVWAYLESADA
jgi:hypothetical protein